MSRPAHETSTEIPSTQSNLSNKVGAVMSSYKTGLLLGDLLTVGWWLFLDLLYNYPFLGGGGGRY